MIFKLWSAVAVVFIIALTLHCLRVKAKAKLELELGEERKAANDRGGTPYTGDTEAFRDKSDKWRIASNIAWCIFVVVLGAGIYLTPGTLSLAQSVWAVVRPTSAPF